MKMEYFRQCMYKEAVKKEANLWRSVLQLLMVSGPVREGNNTGNEGGKEVVRGEEKG